MPRFLVITHPPAPIPRHADVAGWVEYFALLDKRGKARVFPVVGLKGYAIFIDVASHEELLERLRGNPMHDVEETKVYALSEFPPKDL